MIKYRIETESGFRETTEKPKCIKTIETMFVCGGVDHFTFADAQIYQIENSPKNTEGIIMELIPIAEKEQVLETIKL